MVVRKIIHRLNLKLVNLIQRLDYLTEHFNVLQSHKDSGEIMIKAQKDYKQLLKSLAQKDLYPKYIETRKSSLRDTYFNINQRGDK